MAFTLFILDDEIVSLPEHYASHPVLGKRLTPYTPEDEVEVEVDKVVVDNKELPLEQRIHKVVTESNKDTKEDANDDKEID